MKSLFIFVLIIFSLRGLSQDRPFSADTIKYDSIRFVNGSRQAANIIEVSEKVVKYRNPLTPNGPVFVVKKKDVLGFVLKDGCIDLKSQGYENCIKDPTYGIIAEDKFTRRIISIDAFQLLNRHFQMNVDWISKSRKNGIGLLGNIGFIAPDDIDVFNKLESKVLFSKGFYKHTFAGIDYKVFPSPHKAVTYFCAFGFDVGKAYFEYKKNMLVQNGYQQAWYVHETTLPALYTGYRFNNGFIWRLNKNILFQGVLTLGANHFNFYSPDEDKKKNLFFPKILGSFLLGIAF